MPLLVPDRSKPLYKFLKYLAQRMALNTRTVHNSRIPSKDIFDFKIVEAPVDHSSKKLLQAW
jgi:hypothetical protein